MAHTHSVPQASASITSDSSLPDVVCGCSQVQGFLLVLPPVSGPRDAGWSSRAEVEYAQPGMRETDLTKLKIDFGILRPDKHFLVT